MYFNTDVDFLSKCKIWHFINLLIKAVRVIALQIYNLATKSSFSETFKLIT